MQELTTLELCEKYMKINLVKKSPKAAGSGDPSTFEGCNLYICYRIRKGA